MKKDRRSEVQREAVASFKRGELRGRVMDFIVACGIDALQETFDESVRELCGQRHGRRAPDAPMRWGRQGGELVLGGRKVRVQRPRVRQAGREMPVPAYLELQAEDPLQDRALEQMLAGFSTRKYSRSLETLPGLAVSSISKSAVSRRFVAATQARLTALTSARLDDRQWVVAMLDGLRFGAHVILVALGIDSGGNKHSLGLREGSTENATVCRELLAELAERGLPADRHLLFVIDGAKALRKAVDEVFGSRAQVQRCQAHKKRNVLDHLPDPKRPAVGAALSQAYAADSHELALHQLHKLAQSLAKDHPGAAASLREGLEETLTVKRLGLTGLLERSLATTNPIENVNGTIRRVARGVKQCRDGQMALRWVAAALLEAQRGFHRLKGYRDIKTLKTALHALDRAHPVTPLRKAS
jgi:transposase-like protein